MINKTRCLHTVNGWPVAEIANELTMTVLGAEHWVLGAECWDGAQAQGGGNSTELECECEKWLPGEVLFCCLKKTGSQPGGQNVMASNKGGGDVASSRCLEDRLENITTRLAVWEGLHELHALLSILLILSIILWKTLPSIMKYSLQLIFNFYCLSALQTIGHRIETLPPLSNGCSQKACILISLCLHKVSPSSLKNISQPWKQT